MPDIFLYDEFEPEATAMLQALYSRSAESVTTHAEKVKATGSKKFMESYYVGYGHASIGDCGTTTLFIENASILAAKAIQDNPLYSGQETSTRYIDFSKQLMIDPVGNATSAAIQKRWIEFYTKACPIVEAYMRGKFPLEEGQKESVWAKAIKARSFDILRGFLPAGAATQLSWSTNIRQAYDKLITLVQHPLAEVREIATKCLSELKAKYPSSFSHREDPDRDAYLAEFADEIHYSHYQYENFGEDRFDWTTTVDADRVNKEAADVLSRRPKRALLPRFMERYGSYNCQFLLDFGSYRDLQRHRNGLCRIPLLTAEYGFRSWYMEQLPPELRDEAQELLTEQYAAIESLKASGHEDAELQYYMPLGTNILCEIDYTLPQMVYVTELRASNTVHPTLRVIAHKMAKLLKDQHPEMALYADLSPDTWDIKRGLQDIEKKA